MKRLVAFLPTVIAFALATLSYLYLAPVLFYLGLSRFYSIAEQVPEACSNIAAEAAIAFSAIYEYVAWSLALVLVLIGIFLFWRGWTRS